MTATITTTTGGLAVWAFCSADCDAAGEEGFLALQLDSATEVAVVSAVLDAANQNGNVEGLAALIFTQYLWAFELTGALLITCVARFGRRAINRGRRCRAVTRNPT